MNVTKLNEILKQIQIESENELSWRDSGREICEDGWYDEDRFCIALKEKGIVIDNVDQSGGEGEGDHYEYVFSVTEDDGTVTYFKVDGYYASHYGATINPWDFYEVEQVEQVVKVWSAK